MHATTKSTAAESSAVTLAVDLAKDVFELAFADANGRIVARKRLQRGPFERMAPVRGFHDGSGQAHRKAEYTNATAPVLPGWKQKRQQG